MSLSAGCPEGCVVFQLDLKVRSLHTEEDASKARRVPGIDTATLPRFHCRIISRPRNTAGGRFSDVYGRPGNVGDVDLRWKRATYEAARTNKVLETFVASLFVVDTTLLTPAKDYPIFQCFLPRSSTLSEIWFSFNGVITGTLLWKLMDSWKLPATYKYKLAFKTNTSVRLCTS